MKDLKSVTRLIDSFAKLPGVGYKSAEKMAYAVLNMKDADVKEFSKAIENVSEKVHKCPICGSYTEDEICEICSDNERNHRQIIVVSHSKDVLAFESLNTFNGVYHVLGGAISSVNGIGPENLRINELVERIKKDNVEEVIIATNPTTEGEITAMYIAHLLEKENVTVTRLAYGLPMGGHLEYADALTLNKALEGRKKF